MSLKNVSASATGLGTLSTPSLPIGQGALGRVLDKTEQLGVSPVLERTGSDGDGSATTHSPFSMSAPPLHCVDRPTRLLRH